MPNQSGAHRGCPSCGGMLRYDIAKKELVCQQCGQTMDVALYKMDLSGGQDDRMETIEYSCPQCGAATGPHFPDSLEAIQAAPENPHFYSRDGLLYSGKTLCCCPPGMRREEIAVLEGTETILSHAFYDCDLIRRATLPDSVKTIESVAWFSCGKLQSVRLLLLLADKKPGFARREPALYVR